MSITAASRQVIRSGLRCGLNPSVGYPGTAAQVAAAVGYGTWSAGYLCNESSGNLASAFGLPAAATPSGTPVYGNTGPAGGVDKAIGIDSNTDSFSLGNVYDVTGTDDIAFAWVGYHNAIPAFGGLMSKFDGGTGNGYQLIFDGSGNLYWRAYVASTPTDAIVAIPVGAWYAGICTINRGTGKSRIGVRTLAGVTTISAETAIAASSTTNTQILAVGSAPWLAATTDAKLAAFYIAHGSGAATGLSANLASALQSFASAVMP